MEKKNSIAEYVIRVTVIRWVHLEIFLVIFRGVFPRLNFSWPNCPLVYSPPGKLSVSHPGFFWALEWN